MRTTRVELVVLLGLVLAACGAPEGADTSTSTPSSTSTTMPLATNSTTTIPDSTTTTAVATTTTAVPTTTTQSPVTTSPPATATPTMAGEPIDIGPADGHRLMVVGVARDDVLNLRSGPGVAARIIERIPPTYDDLVALGNTRKLPASLWIEVDYDGARGWVNLSYLAYPGPVVDMTADLVSDLGGYPTNPSLTGLAEEIAEGLTAHGDPLTRVVQVTSVAGGSLGEVTYDVVGFADDAVRGLRLHIFAEEGTDGYGMKSVEARLLCGRGVDGDSCL